MKKSNVIIIAALISGTALVCSKTFAADTEKTDLQSIKWTLENLKAQASQDISKVEEEINEVNEDTSISKFDMSKAKSRFEDVVFLGDSITEYLKDAEILDSSSVLAKKGEHVRQAKEHISEIKNLKPKQIVILYGANDLDGGSIEQFEKSYKDLIEELKKVDKGVKIYIQAPLKVDESKTISKNSKINNENVEQLDKIVEKIAKETGAKYLPSDDLITSKKLYENDGIHFKYDFYKNWLFFLSENL